MKHRFGQINRGECFTDSSRALICCPQTWSRRRPDKLDGSFPDWEASVSEQESGVRVAPSAGHPAERCTGILIPGLGGYKPWLNLLVNNSAAPAWDLPSLEGTCYSHVLRSVCCPLCLVTALIPLSAFLILYYFTIKFVKSPNYWVGIWI